MVTIRIGTFNVENLFARYKFNEPPLSKLRSNPTLML